MAVLGDSKEPVVLAYVKIQQPGKKYQSEETEFTVDCIVSEKTAKAWKKQFKKQPPREIETSKFKEIFKIDPPYPDQDEQFIIKLKKDTHFKDKNTDKLKKIDAKYRPRVLLNTGATKDKKPVLKDITMDTLVSNGSTGVVQYEIVTNDFGTFAKLKAVRVDNLIEYEDGASFDELGEVDELAASGETEEEDDGFGSEEGEASEEEEAPFDPDDTDY